MNFLSTYQKTVYKELVKNIFNGYWWYETAPYRFEKTYPDYTMKIIRQHVADEYIISEFIMKGTHRGDFVGITPTNKDLEITGIDIDKVIDGRIVEHDGATNTFETFLNIIWLSQYRTRFPDNVDIRMSIRQAVLSDLDRVKYISEVTISEIYPHYYPKGVVYFFFWHHNEDNILSDIEMNRVFLYFDATQDAIGTVTIKQNEICRLFVLPSRQGMGRNRTAWFRRENNLLPVFKNCIGCLIAS